MQSLAGSADLPIRRATTVVHGAAVRTQRSVDWAGTGWSDETARARRRAEGAGEARAADPFIDLDVLWEELDGLLGQAAASSGARRIGPLQARPGDVASAYRATSLAAPEREPLVDALV